MVKLKIQGTADGSKEYDLKDVRAVSNLSLPVQTLRRLELIDRYPILHSIPLHTYADAKPRLLIGLDNANLSFGRNVLECESSGPFVSETKLGWVIYGAIDSKNSARTRPVLMMKASSYDEEVIQELSELRQEVHDYCEMEAFGVAAGKLMSEADMRALAILENTISFHDGHYHIGLLWKTDNEVLPDNYDMAAKRLANL